MSNSKVAYLVGMCLLLSGCNTVFDEESLEKEIPVPIRFSISESNLSTRAIVTTIDATNVSNVGIYGVQEGSTSGQYTWTASPFAANVVPSGISLGTLSFSPKMYYPTGGKKVAFYAYYPRTTNTSSTSNSYITPPGNGTAPVYNFSIADQQDVMHAIATPVGSNSGAQVAFQYNHKLSQIIINTSILSGVLQSMKIMSVPSKGSMNLATGNITWNSSTTTNLSVNVPLLGGLSDPVLVPANVTTYQLQVTLLVLPTTYYLTPSNGVFSPGVVYTVTLK